MTLHQKHMAMIDAVNNATTRSEHEVARLRLSGWREGVRAAGKEPSLIGADLAQIDRGHGDRPMCCGVFNDWKPTT